MFALSHPSTHIHHPFRDRHIPNQCTYSFITSRFPFRKENTHTHTPLIWTCGYTPLIWSSHIIYQIYKDGSAEKFLAQPYQKKFVWYLLRFWEVICAKKFSLSHLFISLLMQSNFYVEWGRSICAIFNLRSAHLYLF